MSKRKFYKNVITIIVLSEGAPISDEATLAQIEYEFTEGEFSAGPLTIDAVEVSGQEAADILCDQGSQPDFFGLDYEGNDTRGDEE